MSAFLVQPAITETSATPARGRRRGARINYVKNICKRVVALSGCTLNFAFGRRAANRFGILMYHRVVDPVRGLPAPTWNITPSAFRRQMEGLLHRGFQPVSLSEVMQCHESGMQLPRKSFVVTFDDAFESVVINAWPILQDLQIPATLFLSTAFLDSDRPFPFDDWPAAGEPGVDPQTWRPIRIESCRTMAADGLIELGAHTHTHQRFAGRDEDFLRDLQANVRCLHEWFNCERPSLSLPFGLATRSMLDLARQAGVSCALTTVAMPNDVSSSPYGWGRFDVEAWDTPETLSAKLDGWYSWAPELRQRISGRRRPELVSG